MFSVLKKQPNTTRKTVLLMSILISPFMSADDISIVGEIASEPLFQGVSQSPNDPVAKLLIEWDSPSGVFAGAMAYASSRSPAPWRSQGLSAHIGWFHTLGEDQALEYSYSQYHFPGSFSQDWHYQEVQINYHFSRSLSLSVGYSDDYFGRGSANQKAAINWHHSINDNFYTFAEIGIKRFTDSSYTLLVNKLENANIGIGYAINNDWDLKVSIEHANDDIEIFQGDNTAGTRLFASISYLIF